MATSLSQFLPIVGGMNYDLFTLDLNISSLVHSRQPIIIVEEIMFQSKFQICLSTALYFPVCSQSSCDGH